MKKVISLLLITIMLCTCMGAVTATTLEYGRLFPAEAVRKSGAGGTVAVKGTDWYREDWETFTTYQGISVGVELLPGNWITLALDNDGVNAGAQGAGYYTVEAKVANGDLDSPTELTIDTSTGYSAKWPIGYTGAWNGAGFNSDGTSNSDAVWFTGGYTYLRDGENTITITNTGSNKFVLYCVDFALTEAAETGGDTSVKNAFTGAVTPPQAYDVMTQLGGTLGLDVATDIAGIAVPEMAFARFAGRDFATYDEFKHYYDMVIMTEKTEPTAAIYNASGVMVSSLPVGNGKIVVDGKYIKNDMWMIGAIYSGNKLCAVGVCESDGTNMEIPFKGLLANSELKFMFFEDLQNIKPVAATEITNLPDDGDEGDTGETPYKEIYVSANGRARNDGSTIAKATSITKAITLIEENNDNMTGDIVVNMLPGTYSITSKIALTEAASGMNGHNVIFKAYDPEDKPVISGGTKVTGWSQVSGKPYWVAGASTTDSRSLYVNGYQATLARSKYLYKANEYMTPASPADVSHITDGLIVPKTNFPAGLEGETGIGMVFNLAFANHRIPLESVTYDDRYAYLKADYPRYHAIPYFMVTSIAPSFEKPFYLENAMALLDEPGEFYIDKTYKKVYYYPYAQEDMTTAETYIAKSEGLLSIAGTDITSKAENIKFDGISFRYGVYNFATENGISFFQTDNARLGGVTWYGDFLFPQQISVNHADNIEFSNCEFTCLGSSAIGMIEGVTNSRVTGSSFHDISGTGVVVGSFQHNNSFTGDRSKNIEVDNNIFRRCAQEYLALTAIACYYAGSVNIHHNDIKDMPYSGIVMGWGWGDNVDECRDNTIAYNRIENVNKILDDGAHIYTLGVMPNTKISNNYLIDPGNYRRPGIYLDSYSGSLTVASNVVTGATASGDCWFFAREGVNITNITLKDNHTDGKKYTMTSKVKQSNNLYNVTSWSAAAQQIMAEAGPVDKSDIAAVNSYPTWRKMRMNDVATAEFAKSNQNNVWRKASSCDSKQSSAELWFNGVYGGVRTGNYFDYKFTVPTAGNYRVYVAAGALAGSNTKFLLYVNGTLKETVAHPVYTDLYTYGVTKFTPQYLTAGTHTIRIKATTNSPFELGAIKIENMSEVEANATNYDDGIIN